MKKLSIYIFLVMCLLLTGCGNDKKKDMVSLDDFSTKLVEKQFVVSDNMINYTGADYIANSKKGVLNDIEIEMVEYTDSKYAEDVQEKQIDSFNLLKSTGAYEKKEKGSNYYKYVLVSNNYYMISTRVDNTLVFCKTALDNKEIVEDIYNSLGY